MNEKSKINMNLFFLSKNKNILKESKLEKNTNKNKAKKSSKELQEICDEYGLEKVMKPVGFITQSGGTLSRTSTDFRNNLERIKKNHPGSTIKT